MLKRNSWFLLGLLLLLGVACKPTPEKSGKEKEKFKTEQHTDANGFQYETVTNDPLNARIYTLENGLKVYLTVYKDKPRIQTYVAVRAGSKNDPADATGLAHYLEHILFKGTSNIGTTDWEKESDYLNQIEELYQTYRTTTDTVQRKALYHEIDSLSYIAASFTVANEYDKLLSGIGATGTNAYTFVEQTVYVNNIPSNEIERWSEIEAERFGEVVPRLFHTELEAVYEEKNRGLDSDRRKVWENMLNGLFPVHQYGSQTTIGTVEHLQNPSITEIKKYFTKNYIPNNMAICLSGDLDPEATIQVISKNFGKLKKGEVPAYTPPVEQPITSPVVKEVVGPDAENVTLAFRFAGVQDSSSLKMELLSMILSNSEAGLIDLNLNQKQKVLGAYSYPMRLVDYSVHVLAASPKQGQSLDEVRDLLLAQIDSVKQGKFDDWLLDAIINDYKLSQMKSYESNKNRADAFVTAFVNRQPWEEFISEIDALEKITKEDIIKFTQENYDDNYVLVYKRTGVDTSIQKVPKPKITPVQVNRETNSPFFNKIMSEEVEPIQPVFLDYEKDIKKGNLKSETPVFYNKNKENGLFNLYYVFDMGTNNDPKIGLAISYLNYIGSEKYSAEDLKKEFYKLGCSFDVFSSDDQVYVTLSGLQENFDPATQLFEEFLKTPVADTVAYQELVGRILKSRADAKLNKGTILRSAMVSYAKYGSESPFTNIISEEELKATDPNELTKIISQLESYPHRVLYYGPEELASLEKKLNKFHKVPDERMEIPEEKEFPQLATDQPLVYFVEYDMVQAEVIMLNRSVLYDPSLVPTSTMFNEYFGGNMGSIVFQEMRESKALAYAVRSYYSVAKEKEDHNYSVAYIGTQADKLPEALDGMIALLNEMPQSQLAFDNAKQSIKSTMETQRITKTGVLFNYEQAKKLGLDHDIRKDVYTELDGIDLPAIEQFRKEYVGDKPQVLLIIASKDRVSPSSLSKYGTVKELSLEEIFGY